MKPHFCTFWKFNLLFVNRNVEIPKMLLTHQILSTCPISQILLYVVLTGQLKALKLTEAVWQHRKARFELDRQQSNF